MLQWRKLLTKYLVEARLIPADVLASTEAPTARDL